MSDDDAWIDAWRPMQEAVGSEFESGEGRPGADTVEPGAVRRFAEVLELDCPLHHDEDVARAHGYDGILAPATSLRTFTFPPMWAPGDPPNFTSAERDAQPERTAISGDRVGLEPDVPGYFQADLSIELTAPVVTGDRLTWPSRHLLLGCEPKQTSAGRGAFVRTRSEVRNQRGEVVARFTGSLYVYEPWPAP